MGHGYISTIGSGREPIVDSGNVLFKSGGKLNLYDLKSGVIKLETDGQNVSFEEQPFIEQDYGRYLEYEGIFVGGVREGYGRLFISDRQIYEGMFINGVPEGIGKLMDYYGKITYEGQFKDGKPLGN